LRGFLPEQGKQAVMAGSLLHLNTTQGEGWLVREREQLADVVERAVKELTAPARTGAMSPERPPGEVAGTTGPT
jgi:hypothetical protein